MKLSVAFAASFIASVAGHATFQELWINGADQGSYCVRLPPSNSPVTNVTSDDLACNVVSGTGTSANLCGVTPGDTLTVEMHQQPDDRSCANQAIGGAHYGPIIIYLAKVTDATTAIGYEANWFKISEIGLPSNNPDYWGTEVLNDNCGHYSFTVPTGIAPGNYLLRAEVIALHVASSVGGAQFYMSCYQLSIGGSGTASPATVQFPGAYNATDPGILINIYYPTPVTYTIPGPTPYATTSPTVATTAWPTTATWNTSLQPSTVPTAPATAGGGSGSSSTSSTTTTSSSSSSSSKASSTTTTTSSSKTSSTTTSSKTSSTSTSKTTSSSSASSSGAALYGQCGGIGWTGPTTCASGTCTYSNAYYSQCL